MSTIRSQILDAAVVALNASGKPDDVPKAVRRRLRSLDLEDLPFIDVVPLLENAERIGGKFQGPLTKRTMRFAVRCWAAGAAPEVAADAMVAWAVKALAGSGLGGLAHAIEEQETEWQGTVMDSVYGVAEIRFAVQYSTSFDDQEAVS